MARLLNETKAKASLTFRLEEPLRIWLEVEAAEAGMSISDFLRDIIRRSRDNKDNEA